MARVTVEDCKSIVKNRFHLVLLAAARAKEIALGASPMIKKTGDKASVLALREIAQNLINLDDIENTLVQKYRKFPTNVEYDSICRKNEGVAEESSDLGADQYKADKSIIESATVEDLIKNVVVTDDDENFTFKDEETVDDISECNISNRFKKEDGSDGLDSGNIDFADEEEGDEDDDEEDDDEEKCA